MAYKINGTTVVDNSRNVCACCVTSCCITATSRLDAPSGTTAQRPASPATGSVYFDTDLGSLISYNGTEWATLGGGGITTEDLGNDYWSSMHMITCSPYCKLQCFSSCDAYEAAKSSYSVLSNPSLQFSCATDASITNYVSPLGFYICASWSIDGGATTFCHPGYAISCTRGGFNCCHWVANQLFQCHCTSIPKYTCFYSFGGCYLEGHIIPIMNGGFVSKRKNQVCSIFASCGQFFRTWMESYTNPKGGTITKTPRFGSPNSCCGCPCGVNPDMFFLPEYLDPSSCLGPIIGGPFSVRHLNPSANDQLGYPGVYYACVNDNLFTDEEEMCCYSHVFPQTVWCSPFPYCVSSGFCMCECRMFTYCSFKCDMFGQMCVPTSGINACAMKLFTYRNDLTKPADVWNKEMFSNVICCTDGMVIKNFNPSCKPAMWYAFANASCCGITYLTAQPFSGIHYWEPDGNTLWSFKYGCFCNLSSSAGPNAFQTSCFNCFNDTNCYMWITKFCRPCLSFEYWINRQPRCFQPWDCCRGCVFLTHPFPFTETIWCKQMARPLPYAGNGCGTTPTTHTGGVRYQRCNPLPMSNGGGTPIIQDPNCANRLLIFVNGTYYQSAIPLQRYKNVPIYSVFNKSTKLIECTIDFNAMINFSYCNAQLAGNYFTTPFCACGQTGGYEKTRLCKFLGYNTACPQHCIACHIQSITGCCHTSILNHCHGFDFFYYPQCPLGTYCGFDLNLAGTSGNFCQPMWYYNPCSNHIVFVGGILTCGNCNCFAFSNTFQWLGAVCFDLTNCCVSKVNQFFPSTDKTVNCKINMSCRPCISINFGCNLGVASSCDDLKSGYGFSFMKYGADTHSGVGGVVFLASGVMNMSPVPSPSNCCAISCCSCYFGCDQTGACAEFCCAACCGRGGQFLPLPDKTKIPFDVPLECAGFATSSIMKDFFNLRWTGTLHFNPFGASVACRNHLFACNYSFNENSTPFYSGFCAVCCGGCYKADPTVAGCKTMNCCALFGSLRLYASNQIIAGKDNFCICGEGTSYAGCFEGWWCQCCNICKWNLCSGSAPIGSYLNQGIGPMVIDNIQPCNIAPGETKLYSKFAKLKTAFSGDSYAVKGQLSPYKPHILQAGETYLDTALRVYNEGVACVC